MIKNWRRGVRLLVVLAAYISACIVTAFTMVVVASIREAKALIAWEDIFTSGRGWGAIVAYTMFALAVILPFSLVPAGAAIVYAERKRVRSLIAFSSFGAIVAVAAYLYVFVYAKQWHNFGLITSTGIPFWIAEPTYFAFFGAIGGAVYWALAGRRSGVKCD